MPQSLACLPVHLIFSTKGRERLIHDRNRAALHAYMGSVMQNAGCAAHIVNSTADHVHVLFELSRTAMLSEVVMELKKSSSRWMKNQGPELGCFAWQGGYGAFAVSASNITRVRRYIEEQQEHHRVRTFQGEYRAFLKRHRVEFDERYIWD